MCARGSCWLKLIVLALPWVSFAGTKEPIVATDLLRIGRISEVEISPDGDFAVYGVHTIYTELANAAGSEPVYSYRTNLWMADLQNPSLRPVQLTYGDRQDTAVAISPDGETIAFLRADAKKGDHAGGTPQVWLLPLHRAGEAHQLGHLEFGTARPRWRPDGKALLVSSPIPISHLPGTPPFPSERPGREWGDYDHLSAGANTPAPKGGLALHGNPDGDLRSLRDWLEHDAEHEDPVTLTRLNFLGEQALEGELTFTELFELDSSTGTATQLTASFLNHDSASYSPSGHRIVFVGRPSLRQNPDRVAGRSAIWQLGSDGRGEKPFLSSDEWNYADPQWLHDGKLISFTAVQTDQPTYRQSRLAIADASGEHLHWLTAEGEPAINQQRTGAGGWVYYTANLHGGEPLRRVRFTGGPPEEITGADSGVNAFAIGGGHLVYARVSVQNPNELFLRRLGVNGHPDEKTLGHRLTDLNAGWLRTKAVIEPEEHWIKRPDGMKVQYWVMKPASTRHGKPYPVVLDIHGGPASMWGPGEFTMWHEFQIFCAYGYAVVYANPRGSTGYGYRFERANYKDWSDGPAGDVLATLDDAIARDGDMDANRAFVTGGSYAGYLTAWIVGHTNRFRAAAALRGVYDLATFYGESNAYRLVPEEFGGYPWEPATRQLLERESPVNYVADIQTPLLIIHGSRDNRTGVAQSEMLFRALKQLNRPVEYVRYPNVGHELTRSGPPGQRLDHMMRIIEFFERFTQPANISTTTARATE